MTGEDKQESIAYSSNLPAMRQAQRYHNLVTRLVSALSGREVANRKMEAPSPDLFFNAFSSWMSESAKNPEKIFKQQTAFWSETANNFLKAQQSMWQELWPSEMVGKPDHDTGKPDKRFSGTAWDQNPWLGFLKDQYLTSSRNLLEVIGTLEGATEEEKSQIEFFSRQIIDMYSPTNFLATNPDALQKAWDTNGNSLLDGFENLVRDIEANQGRHAVSLADNSAFEIGQNIASTPGKVVFRNELFELLQYAPTTEQVYNVPLVIIPPWINKFYILDLKPKNSFIRYAVEQGFTVFVVSWVNPDASYAKTGFDDYVKDGAAEAIDTVCNITGEEQVNAIGYCIGGTLLATTLARMAKGNRQRVANATFFTTLLDFENPGEITAFLNKSMLEGLEEQIEQQGYLDAFYMARAFSYLRANDLVYGPGIKSYLLGEAPPAFDLLYWNGDSTNLPAAMAREYLHNLYIDNKLMKDQLTVDGVDVKLSDIDIPVMTIATRTDHIAPWKASFSGIMKMSGEKNLVLADSGHIAGIINPPEAKKYGYWTNSKPFKSDDADQWFKDAARHEGSWWPIWNKWMSKRSGEKIAARDFGSSAFPPLEEAPGSYVKIKA